MKAIALVVLTAAAFGVTGCSEVEQTLNKGGDTPCSEYVTQDAHKQRVTITKFVQQRSGDKNDPSGTAVDATMVSVRLLCSVQSNAATPIKSADIAGIFIPK